MLITQDIKIKAETYREFTDKVKEDAKKRGIGSLAFTKAVSTLVVFKDREGNRINYRWAREDEQEISDF